MAWWLAASGLCALVGLSACGRRETVAGGPFEFDAKKSFSLTMAWGATHAGYSSVRLAEDGACEFVRGGYVWKQAKVFLAAAQLNAIGESAVRCRVQDWMLVYSDSSVVDGEDWFIEITQGDARRTTFCFNCFPAQVVDFKVSVIAAIEDAAPVWSDIPADWEGWKRAEYLPSAFGFVPNPK